MVPPARATVCGASAVNRSAAARIASSGAGYTAKRIVSGMVGAYPLRPAMAARASWKAWSW